MKPNKLIYTVLLILIFNACNVIENASNHEFGSGWYKLRSDSAKPQKVYLDITEETISMYKSSSENKLHKDMEIPLKTYDSILHPTFHFTKKSLDIDITTIIFKYRPAIKGLPPQLNTDFNAALFAGWRNDKYHIHGKLDPLGGSHYKVFARAYDFGVFGGLGTTLISPFTTNNVYDNEYNGLIIQYGVAAFLESNVASFGIAAGFDYLMSEHKNIWIYQNQPWVGFVIGLALN